MEGIICGDCIEEMKKFPDNKIDSICCDPPYEIGFMGKSWDAFGITYNEVGGGVGFCKSTLKQLFKEIKEQLYL